MRSAGIVAISSNDQAYVWTGGHYYLQHLVRCVSSLPPVERIGLRDVWWTAGAVTDPFQEVRTLLGAPVVVSPPPGLVARALRWVRRRVDGSVGARDLFERVGIDVFFPAPPCDNSGTPFVFWIPDFQHVRRPDLMTDEVRNRFAQSIARNIPNAARVVLSSFDAQADFASQYPEFANRTHVVQFCSVPDDSWWSLVPAAVAEKYGLPAKFLIVCNQFTRHKNHLLLMETIRQLVARGRDDIHLVCTGSTFDYREEDYVEQVRAFAQRNGLEAKVSILGLIPRAEQIALLRRAAAVVQPSHFEGWSTLVEDAKTLGKTMFVSDLPVHREQLGNQHSWYLDPDLPDDWADAIDAGWDGLGPGPDLAREVVGLEKTEIAKRACGLAFVGALKAAVPDGDS